jgi:DNA-binding transcriptional LysR family regulator
MTLTDRISDFVDERVDVAVRIGALPDSSLVVVKLGSVRWVVCASPAYLTENGPMPSHPSELANHDCITFEGPSTPKDWTFRIGRRPTPVSLRSRLAVTTAEAAIDAAKAGLGVTRVLSYQIASAERDGSLRRILTGFELEPIAVSLVHAGQGLVPLKTRVFLDFATDRLRRALSRDL